jgi:peptidoglycan/xylan/chitin deacetylase (PgdA/CDA1 family)
MNKLNKLVLIIVFAIILLMLSSCPNTENVVEPIPTDTTLIEFDYSNYVGEKVRCTEDIVLFDKDDNEVGLVYQNTFLLLDNNQEYSKIKLLDSEYYVKDENLELSGDLRYNGNHLVSYNKTISFQDSDIENFYGDKIMHIDNLSTNEVYVLPNTDDNRYGIKLFNNIYYINKDLIIKVDEVESTIVKLADELPVMMYHFFYSKEDGGVRKTTNFVEVNEFEEQLNNLNESGYTSLTMIEILLFTEKRAQVPFNSYGITIDDGDPSVYKYAFPLLKKNNICATNFIIGGWMGDSLPYEFLEMRQYGVESQSHSFLMHQSGSNGKGRLMTIDKKAGVEDTIRSFEYVDRGFVYCYPFGEYNNKVIKIIREGGAKIAFTTEFGKINFDSNIYKLPRIRVTGGNDIDTYMSYLK